MTPRFLSSASHGTDDTQPELRPLPDIGAASRSVTGRGGTGYVPTLAQTRAAAP